MARASITIVLPETTDEEAIEIKKDIEKLLEDKTNVQVTIHIAPR